MPYTNPVPTREEWQKLRDTNKVPKGAAKVSIGDSIAKVHKSFSPDTIGANTKDTQQLIKDLTSYIDGTKKKYPAFEAVVTKSVKKKAENHLAFLADITKAKTEYYPRYSAAQTAWQELKNGKGKPKDVAAKVAQLKGAVDAFALIDPAWEAKRPKVQMMHGTLEKGTAPTETDKAAFDKLFVDLKP